MPTTTTCDGSERREPRRAHPDHRPLFDADPTRKHRFLIRDDGPAVVRRVELATGEDMVVIGLRAVPPTADEAASSAAFGSAAVEWLSSRSTSPLPVEDAEWFSTRPDRRHRIRPALAAESDGRPQARWATIVAVFGTRHVRLCLDEATLPRGDRGEDGLSRILSDRASALASGHALDVGRAPQAAAKPVPARASPAPASPSRPAPPPARRAVSAPAMPDPQPTVPQAATTARPPHVASPHRGSTERWKDRAEARPQGARVPWPTLSLPSALDVARRLRARYGRGPIRLYDLRATLGEDAAAATVAALKAFGLVAVGSDGMSRLTQVGHDALDGCPRATAAAAGTPPAYRALAAACGPAPSLAEVTASEIARGRGAAEVASLHALYAETMRLGSRAPA